ncbi:MAG: DUF1549 domain-containing protein [Planctomycetota bacterium]
MSRSLIHALVAAALLNAGLLVSSLEAGDSQTKRFDSPTETIDGMIEADWPEDLTAAPVSGDEEFCRRVWLDLAGVAPPIWRLREFVADRSEDKRRVLIKELLGSQRFATHMANRWNEVLLPADALDDRQGNAQALHQWLRKQFQSNTPYDHLVGGFLTAGGQGNQGPAVYYTSRDVDPVKVAASTSQIFLGLQLQCAQCHDHPDGQWLQEDFWQFAAFFSQVKSADGRMAGTSLIEDERGKEVTLPETDQVMSPRYPGVEEPPEEDPADFRRRQLTIWLASRNNQYFARAAVNRVWAHLFGRGLVDPVDAMDQDNPPTHPELLQYLSDYLVRQRFDLRSLYIAIAETRAYQRSSAMAGDRPDERHYAVMSVKTLSAEQYYDTLTQNVFFETQKIGAEATDQRRLMFLSRMRAAQSDPESYPHGVVQALGMLNGPELFSASTIASSGLLSSLDAPFFSPDDQLEALFLACLSRYPTESEREGFGKYLTEAESADDALRARCDLTWALLNSAECFVCP